MALLEGIGDDVLVVLVFAIAASAFVVYFFVYLGAPGHAQQRGGVVVGAHRPEALARAARVAAGDLDVVPDVMQALECPICLERLQHAVETACGHAFCAACVLEYWRTSQGPDQPMLCPVDRQTVTQLIRPFALRGVLQAVGDEAADDEEHGRVDAAVDAYNVRFESWRQRLDRDWAGIADLDVAGVLAMTWQHQVAIGVALLLGVCYLLSPFDLLPEIVWGPLGLVDDVAIVMALLMQVSHLYRVYRPRPGRLHAD